TDASNELAEIEVVAQRPLVSREIDRLGYDVKADPESATSNLREILRKVPLVSVDNEGNIQVKGSSAFKIYKNGRPNNSYTKNAKDIFAAIPASSIKRIEVITDPGAREDAEGVGCILNIVTDSDSSIRGVTGSANINECLTDSYIPNASLWLTSQIDKVTFAVSGGGNYMPACDMVRGHQESETVFAGNGMRQTYESDYTSPYASGWFGFEGSWEPDTLNLLTAEFNGWKYGMMNPVQTDMTKRFDSEGNLLMSYGMTADVNTNQYFDFDGSVNYQRSTRRKGETLTLSYRISTTRQHNESEDTYTDMYNCDFGYTGRYYNSRLNYIEQTVQADWSRPYGTHHKTDIGGKAIFRNNHSINDYVYRGNPMLDSNDDFTHNTIIGALYADWRGTFGKWTLRAGLRYEYSRLSAKFHNGSSGHNDFGVDLNDFAPNAAVSWNINDENSLKLSYNRNIRRPGISQLDPARSVSPTSVSFGNPALESVAYNNLNLNYSLIKSRFNLDLNVSGFMVNNNFAGVKWAENNIFYSTTRNAAKARNASMSFYFQWSINSKTRWMMNASMSYNDISQPSLETQQGAPATLSRSSWSFNPWTRFSRDLPWKIEAALSAYWWWRSASDVYSYYENSINNLSYNISFSRRFLKDDRLTVYVMANTIFGPDRFRHVNITENPDYRSRSVSTTKGRSTVWVSMSFRFGSLQAQVKKTRAAISNDDVESSKK
ncbi:MAG: TonB-dependent receptor, partial [Muribaculaceae bacterium]|nr:TonB-dependent receptor [Muribaculaceae bacterium]